MGVGDSFISFGETDSPSWAQRVRSAVNGKRDGKDKEVDFVFRAKALTGTRREDPMSSQVDSNEDMTIGLGFTAREKQEARKRAGKLNSVGQPTTVHASGYGTPF